MAGWTTHMLCLMPTHYHVLAAFEAESLSRELHRVHPAYATMFNRRWQRHGHVFDSPATTKPVLSEGHLLETIRHIANNVDPERWPYSSYGAMLSLRPQWSFVDDAFVRDLFPTTEALRTSVNDRRVA